MRIVCFDIKTTFNPALVSLAMAGALERVKAKDELSEERVKAEMSLSPLFGRVIAAGLLDAESKEPVIFIGEEREILELFWHNAQSYNVFIGWNSLAFDMPYLELRSRLQGIEPSVEISQRRYAVTNTNHVDLSMLMMGWQGNRFKLLKHDLRTVALALGLEPPAEDGSHGQFGGSWVAWG